MECFNHACPFRVNITSSLDRCECTACPNRCNSQIVIMSNKTLTNAELDEIIRARKEVTP